MAWPQHSDPKREDRRARAPYNFVPLPKKVVEVKEKLPPQDWYDTKLHTGYIDCTLKTESPLFVRGPLTLEKFEYQETHFKEEKKKPYKQQIKNKPGFFYIDPSTEDPVIPGSSLRGMLRTLIEIAGYGKMDWVVQQHLFFRTVDPTAVGKHYNNQFVSKLGKKGDVYRSKAHGGFWRFNSDGSGEIKESIVVRVSMEEVAKAFGLNHKQQFYHDSGPNAMPKWEYQHRTVWIQAEKDEQDHPSRGRYLRYRKVTSITTEKESGHIEGTLVLTGPMGNKKMAFVFLKESKGQTFKVPRALVKRFHDDDQITPWQRDAFPKGQPKGVQRSNDGYLRDGEPVFFLNDQDSTGSPNETIRFLGRAQLFRLPYAQRPIDLVPEDLRRTQMIDLADAVFGFARIGKAEREEGQQSHGGRVFIMNGRLDDDIQEAELITPHILATPKPTSFQHYLVQDSDDKGKLKHYDDPLGETVIRGHKLYWHKGNSPDYKDPNPDQNSTQHTLMKPVSKNTTFRFRIYFENLRDYELGALLWAITLPGPDGPYRHKLGMGKPLGLGSVHLELQALHISDRRSRYSHLFDGTGNNWHVPPKAEKNAPSQQDLICAFEAFVLEGLEDNTTKSLSQLPRVHTLLTMLKWPGPNRSETGYMGLGEFKERKVLPTPEGVLSPTRHASDTSAQQVISKLTGTQPKAATPTPPRVTEDEFANLVKQKQQVKQKPLRVGQKINAEIIAKEGDRITVRVIGAQSEEVTFTQPYYPHGVGEQTQLKIQKLDKNGRITAVTP